MAIAVMFVGVAFASNDDNNPNACRFRDGDGLYNGYVRENTYSYEQSKSAQSGSEVRGNVEGNLAIVKGSTTGSESSGYSNSRSSAVSSKRTECCVDNTCTENYKTGHSKAADNYDHSVW